MRDLLTTVDLMTDEEAGKLLKAIIGCVDDKPIELSRELMFAFTPIKNQLDRDLKKYDDYVEKQRLNGKKGGRPAKPNNPSLSEPTVANPNNLDTVNVTVTDNETDKEIKITSPSPKADPIPYQKIIDLYHKTLPELPTIAKLTPKRKGQIRQRYTEDMKELTNWENFFDYVSQSDFLMGRVQSTNGRAPFRADIEWLTNQTNFTKIAEEKYHV